MLESNRKQILELSNTPYILEYSWTLSHRNSAKGEIWTRTVTNMKSHIAILFSERTITHIFSFLYLPQNQTERWIMTLDEMSEKRYNISRNLWHPFFSLCFWYILWKLPKDLYWENGKIKTNQYKDYCHLSSTIYNIQK